MNNDTGGKNEVIIKADHKALHALTEVDANVHRLIGGEFVIEIS